MPVPDKRGAIERHLLRDTAYVALCDAIVDGTLAPGETLHDDELCAWLGLSRTPIRGALVRLEDEGLVECAPQRFTRVMPLDAQCARDLFPVLAVLHGLATELGVPRMTQNDLQSLNAANDDYVRALRAVDGAAAYDADERFHAVFLRAAGNDHVLRMIDRWRRSCTGSSARPRRASRAGARWPSTRRWSRARRRATPPPPSRPRRPTG